MEFRLCSKTLAEAWPFDEIPRGRDKRWYRERFGTMFGSALFDSLRGERPLSPSHTLLAYSGVRFHNPEQIAWAIHVAGAAAAAMGISSKEAYRIESFAQGEPPYCEVQQCLRDLGVVSLLEGDASRQLGAWLRGIDPSGIEEEARDLHGPEWASSILAICSDLKNIFLSTGVHGGDICVWYA